MKRKQAAEIHRRRCIQRAVASSTAIETGKPIKTLEALLKSQSSQFRHLQLAR